MTAFGSVLAKPDRRLRSSYRRFLGLVADLSASQFRLSGAAAGVCGMDKGPFN